MLHAKDVTVTGGSLPQKEIEAYLDHLRREHPHRTLASLNIEVDGDFANLSYTFEPVPMERIRRITGYLVGTLDRFNDGKRAEEHDRVKHGVEFSH